MDIKLPHIKRQEDRESYKDTLDSIMKTLKGKTYEQAKIILDLLHERLATAVVI